MKIDKKKDKDKKKLSQFSFLLTIPIQSFFYTFSVYTATSMVAKFSGW